MAREATKSHHQLDVSIECQSASPARPGQHCEYSPFQQQQNQPTLCVRGHQTNSTESVSLAWLMAIEMRVSAGFVTHVIEYTPRHTEAASELDPNLMIWITSILGRVQHIPDVPLLLPRIHTLVHWRVATKLAWPASLSRQPVFIVIFI